MRREIRSVFGWRKNKWLYAVWALALMGCAASGAWAADSVPPSEGDGGWMSFERYHGGTERAPPVATPEAKTPSEPAAVARAINPPVMPGVNKGYAVRVDSTEDQAETLPVVPAESVKPQDVRLREQNWQPLNEFAKTVDASASQDDPDASRPLAVRMTFLPSGDIAPVTAEKEKPGRLERRGLETPPVAKKTTVPVPGENVACVAAIDAYKKKQVSALQSDRQTLEALQAAITQLGLQKQLDFLTNAQGSVSVQANGASDVKMDFPKAE